jgi:hypothetical protein
VHTLMPWPGHRWSVHRITLLYHPAQWNPSPLGFNAARTPVPLTH